MTERQKHSKLLPCALDARGYSYDLVKTRQQYYIEINHALNEENQCFIAGSKSDGLTSLFESDIDYVQVRSDIVCVENSETEKHDIQHATVLHMEKRATPAGYTYLVLVQEDAANLPGDFNKYLSINSDNQVLFSSEKFRSDTANAALKQNKLPAAVITQSGPAITNKHVIDGNLEKLSMSFDHVQAIPCWCPSIRDAWINRPRWQEWPSPVTIAEITTLEAHAVPVGHKASHTSANEWRTCFTKAEMTLVRTFNSTQVKLLALLRIVAKQRLKSICNDFTSYVMKNIVFWMCETTPAARFQEDSLMDLYIESLQLLLQFVENGFVPNYMIPERNLLVDCDHPQKIQQVARELQNCIELDLYLLYQLDSLCATLLQIDSDPDAVLQYQFNREASERFCMQKTLLLLQKEELTKTLTNQDYSLSGSVKSVFNILRREVGLEEVTKLIHGTLKELMMQLETQLKAMIGRLETIEQLLQDEAGWEWCFLDSYHLAICGHAHAA